MADMTSVRALILSALNEADAALGTQTTTQQIAALNASLSAANAQVVALQAKIAAAKTDAAKVDADLA